MAHVTRADERRPDTGSETERDRRQPMHATVRVEKGSCVNPPANVRRHDEIATLIGALRRRFPDRVFRPLGDIDGHHSFCPFSWQLAPKPGGESIAVGLDVAAR